MLNWELRENTLYGTSSLWLFRISNHTKQGHEPYRIFCEEMDKIDDKYFPYDSEDVNKFFQMKLVLEIFSLKYGWTEVDSSKEILVRDIQSHYLMLSSKKQICEFNKTTKQVDYIDDLDNVLEVIKIKLQDHAEFLINSGWNPFV